MTEPRAYVLLTALPPTLGHLRLIQFSQQLADTTVIVSAQPVEPYGYERYRAIHDAVPDADVRFFHKNVEQNPDTPGFWEMWKTIFDSFGFREGDYVVASEPYGQILAEKIGGKFMPFDLNRTVQPGKATFARLDPIGNWSYLLPEFRKHFVQRVTLFGAESVGKTTMAQQLSEMYDSPWLFEWARPYLEAVGSKVTDEKMKDIWQGQLALQKAGKLLIDSPVVFQDTDLFSTLGYWDMWENMSSPDKLSNDAEANVSDLYLICPSNIPFEQDPLRYGGNERESNDQYWIDLCQDYGLNYKVLTGIRMGDRLAEAKQYVDDLLTSKINFRYERQYNDS
jgi:HTH-type transcriptional regulator, transcriptional repressor of NAD biosynthesis genes